MDQAIPANSGDAAYVREHSEVVAEMPPIFKLPRTRWGTPWDERYPTPEPLLTAVAHPWQQVYLDEAGDYTWMCYVRLKPRHGPG